MNARLGRMVERAAGLAGVRGVVDVRISGDVDAPFTVGARRPVVLLPAGAESWSEERLHIVLVHELAHVARLDYVAQLVATAACAIYWFNPIVWLAAARLRAEAEQAADDRVLSAGVEGITYASHLLELARAGNAARLSTAVAVGIAHSNRLERRFKAMLDSTRSRGIVPLRLQAAGGVAALMMAVPMVGLRVIPVAQTTMVTTATPSTSASAAEPAAAVRTLVSTAAARSPSAPVPTIAATAGVAGEATASASSTIAADTVIEKTASASSGERISLDLPTGGQVTVESWDQPSVRVRATLSGDQARETRMELVRESGQLALRASVDRRRNNTTNSNRIELWVPRRFGIAITSAGGGIRISNVEGTLTGHTGGGEIILENVKGEARLSTGGGDVHVSGSHLDGYVTTGGGEAAVIGGTGNLRVSSGSGPVIRADRGSRAISVGESTTRYRSRASTTNVDDRVFYGGFSMTRAGGSIKLDAVPNGGTVRTGGGDVRIGSSSGRLAVATGGGDIEVAAMGGDVAASTGAGDVHITVVNTDGTSHSVQVGSGTGKVTIDLPANIDARFELETAYTERHGPTKIESDFPLDVTQTDEWDGRNGTPRRYVRAVGTAGAGRGLIRIHTVNGDVVIRRR